MRVPVVKFDSDQRRLCVMSALRKKQTKKQTLAPRKNHHPCDGTLMALLRCDKIGDLLHGEVEYRRFARECLEMARTFGNDQARAVLIQMAQVWARLADDKRNEGDEKPSDEP
jgi:hypothetical protein